MSVEACRLVREEAVRLTRVPFYYIYSSVSLMGSVAWIRTMKRERIKPFVKL